MLNIVILLFGLSMISYAFGQVLFGCIFFVLFLIMFLLWGYSFRRPPNDKPYANDH